MAKKKKRSAMESSSARSEGCFELQTPLWQIKITCWQSSYSQGKEIINFLAELKEEMRKQSKQATESKETVCKWLKKVRVEMCQQSKQATEGKEEICKQLDKVKHDNQEMCKQLTEILTDLRKQWDLRTTGSSGDDSDAPRSQSNQVQPPRYRLVFKSGVTNKIEKGQIIDISVALVDGTNDQTVENGPLASATVELVVVNAQFNQHNNQYNWSRQDFESNIIKKARERNSATGDVDQSVKSIGFMHHCGSEIFSNSGNKKVRLGVMVISPKEYRVLEGLSNPFFVRGHDRPNRQRNLRHNRSNTQSQALVDNGYQLQNGETPNLQNPLSPSSTQNGGIS
ncbi:unnamed protein product [Miscanthus lutarioriparius]|uniref:Calmodulin binding protein-like N-terminal domain-containing protein n=1 Tax=Miscanthus lutarioriparius TaxID=422564 RepID=A0A811QA04_9POAL|nr:unnamed protein product [Miscanthus lutarioriparius]